MTNIGSILLGLGILVVSALFVLDPFRQHRARNQILPQKANKVNLETLRLSVLTAIRDLDFDYRAGKVNEEDYHNTRAQLVAQAAGLIETQKQEDQILEALVTARKQQIKKKTGEELKCQHCGRPLTGQDAFCPGCGTATGKHTCPKCGTTVNASDIFCTGCGRRLEKASESERQSI